MTKNISLKTVTILLGVLTAILVVCIGSLPDGKLHLITLEVGQGDAILLKGPFGETMLIDGGPDGSVMQGLGKWLPFYDKTIDAVVITHPHDDHINGLIPVINNYNVKSVILTGVRGGSATYKKLLEIIAEKRVSLHFAGSNNYHLGSVMIEVLYPFQPLIGETFTNQNGNSIVLRLIYGNTTVQLDGDAEKDVEKKLIARGRIRQTDVLKTGHHGSRTATSEDLLNIVRPRVALISVGKGNSFRHPHAETIDLLQSKQISILRTDLNGTIALRSDGFSIQPD